jgi:tetratricopeptide (TPR) repeat protein
MIRHIIVAATTLLFLAACAGHRPPVAQPDGPIPAAQTAPAAEADQPADGKQPTDSEVMYRVFAAELLGNQGDLEGAVAEYLEAAMESDDPEIARRATRVAFAAQAWQQASMAADRWALLDPGSIPAREAAALSMLATADYVGAELQLRELVKLSTDKEQAWLQVSSLLARSASPEKATKVLELLLAEAGAEDSAVGLYARSQLAVRTGEIARAAELAGKAAQLESGRVEFLAWAGRLALAHGDKQAGMDYMRRAWELNPQDHDLTLAYADLLARDGQEEKARQLMREMVQTPDVVLSRILFELTANQVDAAFSLYQDFRTMEFEDPQEKAFYQARAAESLDLLQDAIDFYQQIEDGEFFVQATSRRAELMAMQGDMEGAKKTLAVLREQPDRAVVEQSWLAEARILQQAHDPEGAFQSLDGALEQLGDSVAIRYSHALLAAELGRIDVAESDLRMILAEQPDHAAALNALGYTLADQTDRYQEAEELIKHAYSLQPDDASIVDSMGWVAYRMGRLGEAEEFLNRAWALDKNAEIGAHLGEVLWQQGKHDRARDIWGKSKLIDENNKTLLETIKRLEAQP